MARRVAEWVKLTLSLISEIRLVDFLLPVAEVPVRRWRRLKVVARVCAGVATWEIHKVVVGRDVVGRQGEGCGGGGGLLALGEAAAKVPSVLGSASAFRNRHVRMQAVGVSGVARGVLGAVALAGKAPVWSVLSRWVVVAGQRGGTRGCMGA